MADRPPPLMFTWTGEVMEPGWSDRVGRHYEVGAQYWLVPHEERSQKSHSHFFACVVEAWKNLPENLAEQVPSAEHLRKWAMIHTGWRDDVKIVAASEQEAHNLAGYVKVKDEFAVVVVHETVATIYTAKSQSLKAMGKDDFQKSKDDVLSFIANLVGVSVEELTQNAGMAA